MTCSRSHITSTDWYQSRDPYRPWADIDLPLDSNGNLISAAVSNNHGNSIVVAWTSAAFSFIYIIKLIKSLFWQCKIIQKYSMIHNTGAICWSMNPQYVWLTVSNLVCAAISPSFSWTKLRSLIRRIHSRMLHCKMTSMTYTAENMHKQIQYWNYY